MVLLARWGTAGRQQRLAWTRTGRDDVDDGWADDDDGVDDVRSSSPIAAAAAA